MAPTIIRSVVTPTLGLFTGGDPYDLIDLDTLKTVLQADDSKNAFLKILDTQASTTIRKHCNRTFQIQTYQDLFWADRDPYPWQLPSGFKPLQLWQWPIVGPPCLAMTAAPLAAGALSAIAGGALQTQNYFVRVTYQTPTGESPVSPEVNRVVPANNLLSVASPQADPNGIATGWNVYVGTKSGGEVKQNGAAIAIGAPWTMIATGPQPGEAMPTFVSVTLNSGPVNGPASSLNVLPQNLIEGQDFIVDYERGELTRLFSDGYPCKWEMLPIQVVYQAGFATIPAEIQDACIRLVRSQYFSQDRDPLLMSENIAGAYEARYWVANPNASAENLPRDVLGLLSDYRVPVMG